MDFVSRVFELLALCFVVAIGCLFLSIIIMYMRDRLQTKHAIRRNFPVVGRFRYTFEHLGEFFRQYFFAFDREEMPFNRAERSWVYRAAKGDFCQHSLSNLGGGERCTNDRKDRSILSNAL
jgi:hypothetical protein